MGGVYGKFEQIGNGRYSKTLMRTPWHEYLYWCINFINNHCYKEQVIFDKSSWNILLIVKHFKLIGWKRQKSRDFLVVLY